MGIVARMMASRPVMAIARFAAIVRDPRWPHTRRMIPWGRTAAGERVTPDTSVQISTVWAAIRFISQTVASLDWNVKRQDDKGLAPAMSHHVQPIVSNRASIEWSSFQFRETMVHWAIRFGNGYAEIERDLLGRPSAMHPLEPWRCQLLRDLDTGALFLRVDQALATQIDIPYENVFHLRGYGDGVVGVSVIEIAAESLGWAKAAMLFGAAFFGNGMNVSGIVETDKKVEPDELREIRQEYRDVYQRGARHSGGLAVFDKGMKFTSITIDPNKAQFIETNQYLVLEICRWIGVPPHKVAELSNATYSNIESQSIEVVQDSIYPWVKRLQDEAEVKLFGQNRSSYVTRMDLKGLMRADSAARGGFYQLMRNMGVYSADDILRSEGENIIGGKEGGARIVQKQYVLLSEIADPPEPEPVPPQLADPPGTAGNDPGKPAEGAGEDGAGDAPDDVKQAAARIERMLNYAE